MADDFLNTSMKTSTQEAELADEELGIDTEKEEKEETDFCRIVLTRSRGLLLPSLLQGARW